MKSAIGKKKHYNLYAAFLVNYAPGLAEYLYL